MLKCKDKKWYQFWLARRRSSAPWTSPSIPSPVHPSIHPPLQAFFTETLGRFFPSTMMNTILTSVLQRNWGADREARTTSEGANELCLFMFLSLCLSLFGLSSEVHTWRSFILILPNTCVTVPALSPSGPVFTLMNKAEKRQTPNREAKTTNVYRKVAES